MCIQFAQFFCFDAEFQLLNIPRTKKCQVFSSKGFLKIIIVTSLDGGYIWPLNLGVLSVWGWGLFLGLVCLSIFFLSNFCISLIEGWLVWDPTFATKFAQLWCPTRLISPRDLTIALRKEHPRTTTTTSWALRFICLMPTASSGSRGAQIASLWFHKHNAFVAFLHPFTEVFTLYKKFISSTFSRGWSKLLLFLQSYNLFFRQIKNHEQKMLF